MYIVLPLLSSMQSLYLFVAPWERDQRNLYAPNVYAEMLVDAKVVFRTNSRSRFYNKNSNLSIDKYFTLVYWDTK